MNPRLSRAYEIEGGCRGNPPENPTRKTGEKIGDETYFQSEAESISASSKAILASMSFRDK